MPKQTSAHPPVTTWLKHIHPLAEDIGPHGPMREGKRQGAFSAQAQFEQMSLEPSLETLQCLQSIFHPPLLDEHMSDSGCTCETLIGITLSSFTTTLDG